METTGIVGAVVFVGSGVLAVVDEGRTVSVGASVCVEVKVGFRVGVSFSTGTSAVIVANTFAATFVAVASKFAGLKSLQDNPVINRTSNIKEIFSF